MAGKLAVSTVVRVPFGVDAGGESFKVITPDDDVPDWAVEQIGDHCWEGGKKPSAAAKKTATRTTDEK